MAPVVAGAAVVVEGTAAAAKPSTMRPACSRARRRDVELVGVLLLQHGMAHPQQGLRRQPGADAAQQGNAEVTAAQHSCSYRVALRLYTQLIVSPGKCLPLLNACHTCFSHCGCSGRCLFPLKSMPHLFFRLQAMAGVGPMAGQTTGTHQAGAYQADSAFQAAQPAKGCCTTAHRAVSPGLRLGLLGAWATIA